MKKLHSLVYYLIYWVKSTNEHGVHSPFVFDILNQVIYNKTPYYAYEKIEQLRAELQNNYKTLNINDLGAGSTRGNSKQKSIASIANYAAKPKKYGQLLFRLVNYFQPEIILELGTSLGITSSYLAIANSKSKVISIEGSAEIAQQAENNFKSLDIKNINLIMGNFDEQLPILLNQQKILDFVFFDGNHQKAATLKYFNICLAHTTEKSVFVFDDIYWSKEMTEAWEEIKRHPKVTVTIDLFFIGLVFFRKEQAKQHFIIKF